MSVRLYRYGANAGPETFGKRTVVGAFGIEVFGIFFGFLRFFK